MRRRHKKQKRTSVGIVFSKIVHAPIDAPPPYAPTPPPHVAPITAPTPPSPPPAPPPTPIPIIAHSPPITAPTTPPAQELSLLTRRKPQLPRDIIGMELQVGTFMRWVQSTAKTKHVCLLTGPPGVGKSSAAQVVAKQENLAVVEINASENRSSALLEKIIRESCASARKDDRRRMLLIEEIDGSYDSGKGGCVDILLDNVKKYSKKRNFPVIVATCNDPFKRILRKLTRQNCVTVTFPRLKSSQALKLIRRSMKEAEIKSMSDEHKQKIVDLAGGDARQVLYALELYALTGADGVSSGDRGFHSNKDVVCALLSGTSTGTAMERHVTGAIFPVLVQHNLARNVSGASSDVLENLSELLETVSFAETLHQPAHFQGEDTTLAEMSAFALVSGVAVHGSALLRDFGTGQHHLKYDRPDLFVKTQPDWTAALGFQDMLK